MNMQTARQREARIWAEAQSEVEAQDEEFRVVEAKAAEGAEPLAGRLFTCSYRDMRSDMGIPVRITRGAPRFQLQYTLAGSIMRLAPSWAEFQIAKSGGTSSDFVRTYQERLHKLGLANIEQRIKSAFPSGNVVLLCFEHLHGLSEPEQVLACHRRAFADWYQRVTGDEVKELSLVRSTASAEFNELGWKPVQLDLISGSTPGHGN